MDEDLYECKTSNVFHYFLSLNGARILSIELDDVLHMYSPM